MVGEGYSEQRKTLQGIIIWDLECSLVSTADGAPVAARLLIFSKVSELERRTVTFFPGSLLLEGSQARKGHQGGPQHRRRHGLLPVNAKASLPSSRDLLKNIVLASLYVLGFVSSSICFI